MIAELPSWQKVSALSLRSPAQAGVPFEMRVACSFPSSSTMRNRSPTIALLPLNESFGAFVFHSSFPVAPSNAAM